MSYEKQTWQTGDVITANKMNHMEDGIADAGGGGQPLEITGTENEAGTKVTLDKTFNEIEEAFPNCFVWFGKSDGNEFNKQVVVSVQYDLGKYHVIVGHDGNNHYTTTTADGYPEWEYD